MAKLISKTYGDALFELAIEEDKIDALLGEIEQLRHVLSENEDFGRLMNHPKVIKEEKIQVARNVFEGRMSDELLGFLVIIISKDRYRDIPKFYRCKKRQNGEKNVDYGGLSFTQFLFRRFPYPYGGNGLKRDFPWP